MVANYPLRRRTKSLNYFRAIAMRYDFKLKLLFVFSSLFLNVAYADFEPAREIKPGLWVASKVVDGEDLYFGFQTELKGVVGYDVAGTYDRGSLEHFAFSIGSSDNRQSLGALIISALKECKSDAMPCPALERKLSAFSPMSNQQKQEFLQYVFGSKKDPLKLVSDLESMAGGADFIQGTSLAWMSVKPITDYRDFGPATQINMWKNPKIIDFDKLYKSNQDLVMIVAARAENKIVMRVRGVFKPPHELLYRNHKNMVLLFHGYVAHVAKSLGRTVYLIPDAVDAMANMIKEAVEGKKYRGVSMNKDSLLGNLEGKKDPEYQIKAFKPIYLSTEELEKLFTQSR